MKAIVLAAGRGNRLKPYTDGRPKCLLELAGATLVERQLVTLRAAGIADVVIVTGYKSQMLALPGTRQVHNPAWDTTNMVESLFCANDEFGDDMIVAYGDIVYEPRVLRALLNEMADIAVVVDRNWRHYWETRFDDPLGDAESLRLDSNGNITDIGGKVSNIDDIQAQYIGLMRFRKSGISALRKAHANLGQTARPWIQNRTVSNAYMTDLIMELILTGTEVRAVQIEGGWLEMDSTADYELAQAMISDGRISAFFDPSATPRVP